MAPLGYSLRVVDDHLDHAHDAAARRALRAGLEGHLGDGKETTNKKTSNKKKRFEKNRKHIEIVIDE